MQRLTAISTKTFASPEVGHCMMSVKDSINPILILSSEMPKYLDIEELTDAICIRAYCGNDREDLKTAIGSLVDEAYAREIIPSFIDFNPAANNELAVTLYGYPQFILNPTLK